VASDEALLQLRVCCGSSEDQKALVLKVVDLIGLSGAEYFAVEILEAFGLGVAATRLPWVGIGLPTTTFEMQQLY
jgi:hypothetical protein